MPTTDLQISASIRALLASHWIDTEKLHFRTTAGTVRFYGVLARQGSFAVCALSKTFFEALADEIQRTPGVQKVYFTGVEIERHKRTSATEGEDETLAGDESRPRQPEGVESVELEPQAHGAE